MISKGESTRQAILDSAYELFLHNGYSGTSMRQIARDAGIALGGIYNHFENKEQLFGEVLDAFHPYHDLLPALVEAPGDTPEEIIQQAVSSIRQFLDSRPQFMNLVFIEIVEFEGRHLATLMGNALPLFNRLIQRFNQFGDGLRPVSVPAILQTFLGMVFSYAMTSRFTDNHSRQFFAGDALDEMAEIFLYGILSRQDDD